MNADPHINLTLTVVVRCGFVGCDWRMEIGEAPLEAHHAYLDHLDVHDPDHPSYYEAEHDAEVTRALAEDKIPGAGDRTSASIRCPKCQMVSHNPNDVREGYCGNCHAFTTGGLYAGDSAEKIAADQARVDRFMAGGNDA